MKLSLKKIAVAVALAATAASASAAIDTGITGNGELFLSVWDANGSYSFDLNSTIDSFATAVNASGSLDLVYSLTNFSSYLTSVADTSLLKWNVQANDNSGARRLLETFSVMPGTTKASDVIRSTTLAVQTYVNAVNTTTNGIVERGADYVIAGSSSPAFAGITAMGSTLNSKLNFSNAGTLTNNSYADGLNLMTINAAATGIAASTYNQYFDGSAVRVYLDQDQNGLYNLHIAAVPEPESYAMLLAGLGMIGFMARRRLGKRA